MSTALFRATSRSRIANRLLSVGVFLHELDIGGDHFLDEVDEGSLGAPIEHPVGFRSIAQQKLHFRWTIKFRVHLGAIKSSNVTV